MSLFLLVLMLVMMKKFFSFSNHTLMKLLTLEVVMLLNFLMLIYGHSSNLLLTVLIFISLAVMEACLGLGLMIQLTRHTGQDSLSYLYSFKLNKLLAFKAKNVNQLA